MELHKVAQGDGDIGDQLSSGCMPGSKEGAQNQSAVIRSSLGQSRPTSRSLCRI
jgi:hypothetical protein